MDLVLFGIQGSGKGTQAKKLAADFGYTIVEMGGEMRKIIASGSELGQLVASYLNKGELAPVEVIVQVMKRVIDAQPKDQPILFDSVVRNMAQLEHFKKLMPEAGRAFHCIHLTLPRDIATQRILERAKIEGRTDDANLSSINRRMDIFFENTMPVIQEFEKEGKVTEVDGLGSVDEVYNRMRKAVMAMAVTK